MAQLPLDYLDTIYSQVADSVNGTRHRAAESYRVRCEQLMLHKVLTVRWIRPWKYETHNVVKIQDLKRIFKRNCEIPTAGSQARYNKIVQAMYALDSSIYDKSKY